MPGKRPASTHYERQHAVAPLKATKRAARVNSAARDTLLAELGYMTTARFALLLGTGLHTVQNRRDLPPRYKLGADSVYRIEEVKAWIARRKVQP